MTLAALCAGVVALATETVTELDQTMPESNQVIPEGYEQDPNLDVRELLTDDMIQDEHHRVKDVVRVENYGYVFDVETDWGDAIVWSKARLLVRLQEYRAIIALQKESQTKAFLQGFEKTTLQPVDRVWRLVTDPITTLKRIPTAANRFLRGNLFMAKRTTKKVSAQVSESTTELAAATKQGYDYTQLTQDATETVDKYSREYLGYTYAKLNWARKLSVDPYTDNQDLQEGLERMAWATALGSFTSQLVVPTYSPLNYATQFESIIWDTPPYVLEKEIHDTLTALDLDPELIEAFLDHPVYRLSDKTAITLGFKRLAGVEGPPEILAGLLPAQDRDEVSIVIQIMTLLQGYHQQISPISRVLLRRDTVAAYTVDGTMIVPMPIEYLNWTPDARDFVEDPVFEHPKRELWVSGVVSDWSRKEMEKRNWVVHENSLVGFVLKGQDVQEEPETLAPIPRL